MQKSISSSNGISKLHRKFRKIKIKFDITKRQENICMYKFNYAVLIIYKQKIRIIQHNYIDNFY